MDDIEQPLYDGEDGVEDIEFSRETAAKLYSNFPSTHPERWLRAREEIHFADVVTLLTGFTSNPISCPFHGRDSKPSFCLYPGSNDGYCFGCGATKGYYDSITFVETWFGIDKLAALKWLEKQFNLVAIADVDPEEYAAENTEEFATVNLTWRDVKDTYVHHARRDVERNNELELAKEYMEILFASYPPRAAMNDSEAGDPRPLVAVLSPEDVAALMQDKLKASPTWTMQKY